MKPQKKSGRMPELRELRKTFYRRNLPHWQPPNAVFFITARLNGSLPKERIIELQKRKAEEEEILRNSELSEEEIQQQLLKVSDLYFGKYDDLLDHSTTGPHWLKQDNIAQIWADGLTYFDGKRYKVICSTIMSNHVHFIFYKLTQNLSDIMHSLKSFTGNKTNKILGTTGQKFWQAESFDRTIRNRTELGNRINYVLNNPVKIGLVKHWKDWKYNYIHPDFLKFIT